MDMSEVSRKTLGNARSSASCSPRTANCFHRHRVMWFTKASTRSFGPSRQIAPGQPILTRVVTPRIWAHSRNPDRFEGAMM